VAWYLKAKQAALEKLIVLDAIPGHRGPRPRSSREAWKALTNIDYRAHSIGWWRWIPAPAIVRTEFDREKYDVLNLIPHQAGGGRSRWMPGSTRRPTYRWVRGWNHVTYESVEAAEDPRAQATATTGLPVADVGECRAN
jgi:hypothetical protein